MRAREGGLAAQAPLTMVLLLINVALYGVTAIRSENFIRIDSDVLHGMFGSTREGMWEGEWLRLIAPNFLHGGLMHILFNMSALYYLGPSTEVHFGSPNFGTLYLLSGVCGFCFSQIFGGNLSIGASCCIFGMMGAQIAVRVLACPVLKYAWRSPDVREQAFNMALYFGIGLAGAFGNVDNWGHLGGFIGGVVLGCLFEVWQKNHRVNPVAVAGVSILFVALICAARWTVFSPYYHIHMAAVAMDENDGAPDRNLAGKEFEEAKEWGKFWHEEPRINGVILAFQHEWTIHDAREYGYKFIAMREQMMRKQMREMEQ